MTIDSRVKADPEFELLLAASRTQVDGFVADRVHELVDDDFEWGHFLFLGRYHRVLELLYQSLRKAVPGVINGEVENYLRNVAHRTVAYNMVLLRELGRLSDELKAVGIDMINFKGPVLAHLAYGNMGLRSSVDLDFLIRDEDLPRLEEFLQADGYDVASRMQNLNAFQRTAYLRLARQISFVDRRRAVGLDVHTHVMPPGYRYAFSFDDLLERSNEINVGGFKLRVFAPEDTIHLLCFHGVKNRWDHLKHVCDVAEFARAHPDLDWDDTLRRAEKTRGERILYHGLHLARMLLDFETPPEVTGRIKSASYLPPLANIAVDNLLRSHQQVLGRKERINFHLRTQDNLANKTRYCLYSVMRHVGGIIDI
jgi:hypothetical protein